ncbi:hypothetical protein RRG08_014366 [Elysia crispata]|uniref:Uncharacterized protein n=1 Tax=Elysia crispata TaxID=231223 RepID=A0AAE0YNA7_9GAST|nr:hypothetical protein RRG08_014366 [Elysia crispata]
MKNKIQQTDSYVECECVRSGILDNWYQTAEQWAQSITATAHFHTGASLGCQDKSTGKHVCVWHATPRFKKILSFVIHTLAVLSHNSRLEICLMEGFEFCHPHIDSIEPQPCSTSNFLERAGMISLCFATVVEYISAQHHTVSQILTQTGQQRSADFLRTFEEQTGKDSNLPCRQKPVLNPRLKCLYPSADMKAGWLAQNQANCFLVYEQETPRFPYSVLYRILKLANRTRKKDGDMRLGVLVGSHREYGASRVFVIPIRKRLISRLFSEKTCHVSAGFYSVRARAALQV